MFNEEILVPISFFAMIFGVVYIYLNSRSKERLALIEKNIDATLFYGERKERLTFWTLRLGALMLGFGIGLLVGILLESTFNNFNLIAPPLFIFSGIFWIMEFIIEKKMLEKSEK